MWCLGAKDADVSKFLDVACAGAEADDAQLVEEGVEELFEGFFRLGGGFENGSCESGDVGAECDGQGDIGTGSDSARANDRSVGKGVAAVLDGLGGRDAESFESLAECCEAGVGFGAVTFHTGPRGTTYAGSFDACEGELGQFTCAAFGDSGPYLFHQTGKRHGFHGFLHLGEEALEPGVSFWLDGFLEGVEVEEETIRLPRGC